MKVPSGSQCEQCWTLWQQAFSRVSWESLIQSVAKDANFKNKVEEARQVLLHAKDAKPLASQGVFAMQGVSLKIERSYVVLTERDMRRSIGRTQLKSLQSVQIPCEDGRAETETGYLFKDEEAPHRKLCTWGASWSRKI